MSAPPASVTLQIGEWIVDPALDCISRNAEIQKLEPRAMRLLLCLADSAGTVVSVDRLLAEVWPDVIVGSASVYQAVSQLRRHLGDPDRNPTYIATVPRKGYRLIAPVTRTAAPAAAPAAAAPIMPGAAAPPARRAWILAGAFAITALLAVYASWERGWLPLHAGEKAAGPAAVSEASIAVLPFTDLSEQHDQEYFSDGLSEELIDMLTKVPRLHVPARTSSFYFKHRQITIPDIGRELKVAHVLEGSVRKSGHQLRITAQLIRVDTGYHLWSETYDRPFDDIFKIQDEIATAVVSALKLKLAGGYTSAGVLGTASPEAYNAYLLGRQRYSEASESGYRQAIRAYQDAIALDTDFADAYAELAMAEYFLGDDTGDLALEKSAEQAAQKAIDIDARRAGGHSVRGYLRFNMRYDWSGAEADFRNALTLDPSDSRIFRRYASMLNQIGRSQEAAALLQKGLEQDPLDATTWTGLVDVLMAIHNYPAAYDAVHRALAIRPADISASFQLGCLQLVDGKPREALATFQGNGFAVFRDTGTAMAQHSLGDARLSQQALDAVIATAAGEAAYQIAQVYAWRDERDHAFEWLERAYRQQDGGLTVIKTDQLLASLRADPRYPVLLRKLNLPP
jgi:TolB-like protein/DNA-binding winged helix-turn-helix (wHTH) protein/thioredoxin-like negative regulator of GroEL